MSLPAPSERDSGLPQPRTALVGRAREVDDITTLLRSDDVPLLTITGPGGCGKTRIAITVANALVEAFAGGVWFVPLSGVSDPALVLPTIAQALGLRESGTAPVDQRIASRLRGSDTLIVLDNMEQVRAAAPDLGRLLQACRQLRLLVTSRVVLRLSMEHVYSLAGLPVPPDEPHPSLAGGLAENEAVRLFEARAQASDATFRLTPENLPSVAGICRQLDGLPLGIEIAAARVRSLSPQALHARLSNRLTVLTSRFEDLPLRHRTVRDTVAWSVQLLTAEERRVFAALSVFAGDFSLEAARAVAAGGDVALDDEFAMLDLLASLVDQSLLVRLSSDGDDPVFRMLRMLSDYGTELLEESGDLEAVRERHARYYLDLAERAAPHLNGADQVIWLETLERSIGDLRRALAWFEEQGAAEERLRLAVALWPFGYTRGRMTEARRWLHGALVAWPHRDALRAQALNAEGLLAAMQDDLAEARAALDEAMAISKALGDPIGVALAHGGLGDACAAAGDRERAIMHYTEARELFRQAGDRANEGRVLTNLGNLYWDAEQLDAAVEHHRAALPLYEAAGAVRGTVWSSTSLGTVLVELGRHQDGVPFLRTALDLAQQLGDLGSVVNCLEGFAGIAGAKGQHESETMLLAASESLRNRIGMPHLGTFQDKFERRASTLRQQLGAAFEPAWNHGWAMPLSEAVALALESDAVELPADAADVPDILLEHGITRREIDVMRMIAVGKTDKEVAEVLSISPRTVSSHVSNILGKLDVPNRAAISAFALRHGVV